MPHSHVRNAKTLFALVAIGLAGACTDSSVAPTRDVAFKAPPGFDIVVGVRQFSIDGQAGAVEVLGNHTINIPANAICDPEVSTYGLGEWDEPCTPLTGSIAITATMLEDNAGNPYVDFQPALRFVPTKEVNLFLRSASASSATMLNIEYCNNLGFCFDEAVSDSTLITRRLPGSAVAVRRIKHFSGYMISSGAPCTGTIVIIDGDEWCEDGEGGFGARRSGYMVASGVTSSNDARISKKRNDQ